VRTLRVQDGLLHSPPLRWALTVSTMNKEWLGLIIPLWFLLFFMGYFSLIPALFESGEGFPVNKKLAAANNWLSENSGRLYVMAMAAILPLFFLGFTLGYFQSRTQDRGTKILCYFVGLLNLVLLYGIYRYQTSHS